MPLCLGKPGKILHSTALPEPRPSSPRQLNLICPPTPSSSRLKSPPRSGLPLPGTPARRSWAKLVAVPSRCQSPDPRLLFGKSLKIVDVAILILRNLSPIPLLGKRPVGSFSRSFSMPPSTGLLGPQIFGLGGRMTGTLQSSSLPVRQRTGCIAARGSTLRKTRRIWKGHGEREGNISAR